jgi:murein DD-endopeptidase MepM/ murein hydrolase activator NlpD
MSKNQAYAEKYAEAAMEQMKRYGIPASVILAQGILESSNGQSQLAQNENNHFGIKATSSWLNSGGKYALYTDDRPNEKFCKYDTVSDSYEHHSQFLKNNKRYSQCFSLSPDDYKGWTKGIERAGYATGGGYASSLQSIIERNGLQKYDQMVMNEMRSQGKQFGVEQNARQTSAPAAVDSPSTQTMVPTGEYSFSLKREAFLFVTSPFGMRNDPMGSGKQQMHKGIDIRAKQDDILATESNGKVVAVNHSTQTGGGKSVTVEYSRPDNTKVQVSYMHLSIIGVKVGDVVSSGQKLGVTGNTGTRTTGEHLHFSVKNIAADGTSRDVDPASYLAEIAQKGNLSQQALHNGNDLLAKYKSSSSPAIDTSLSPDEWMKKLLSSEDSSVGLSGNDPVMSMATAIYSGLLMLAVQIDNQNEDEQKAQISESVSNRQIDLKSLVPAMKECHLTIGENGKAVLHADNGTINVAHELSSAEMARLSQVLGNSSLSNEAKEMRVAGIVNTIVLSQQASQNYEQGMAEQEGQAQNLQRK